MEDSELRSGGRKRSVIRLSNYSGFPEILSCFRANVPLSRPLRIEYPGDYYHVDRKPQRRIEQIRKMASSTSTQKKDVTPFRIIFLY